MDAKAEWVERVLGVAVRDSGQAATDVLDAASLKEWLDDLNAMSSVLPEPSRTEMLARVRQARSTIASPDAQAATAALMTLAADIATATREARRTEAEAAAADRRKQARIRKLQVRWRDAETEARDDFDAFIKRLLADPEVKQAPAYDELSAASAEFAALFPDFDDGLADALDDLHAAADDKRRDEARARALQALDGYARELANAEGLRDLQELADGQYGGMMFFSRLEAELAALRGEIAKVG